MKVFKVQRPLNRVCVTCALIMSAGMLTAIPPKALAAGPGQQVSWLGPGSGNWTEASKWTTSVVPNNGTPVAGDSYDVLLGATGSPYTVTVDSDIILDSVTLDSPNATLLVTNGTFQADVIDIKQGLLQFGENGPFSFDPVNEIVGATIVGNGGEMRIGTELFVQHVLRGVTLDIDLTVPSTNLSPATPTLTIADGLSIAAGRALRAASSSTLLQVLGTQTITGSGEIQFGPGGTLSLEENTILTLGPDLTMRGGVVAHSSSNAIASSNNGLINKGLLSSNTSTAPLVVFHQEGSAATFVNEGIVEAIGTGTVVLGGHLTNLGTFRIRDGGTLTLAGRYSTGDIGTIDRVDGNVILAGIIDNTGSVLGPDTVGGAFQLGGYEQVRTEILGGRLTSNDNGSLELRTLYLDDVTLAGHFNVRNGHGARILNDLTLDGALVQLSPSSTSASSVWFADRDTPQRLTGIGAIEFTGGNNGFLAIDYELTIEPDIEIRALAGRGEIRGGKLHFQGDATISTNAMLHFLTEEFVNEGTIDSLGLLRLGRDRNSLWRNEGVIHLRNGSRLELNGTFRTTDLGTVINDGVAQVHLLGTLDNEGQTLDLEALPFDSSIVMSGGRIRGGIITSSGDADLLFTTSSVNPGTLDGVTMGKNLHLTGSGARADVLNGLTLDGVDVRVDEGAMLNFPGNEIQLLDGSGTIYGNELANANGRMRVQGAGLIVGEGITIRNGVRPDLNATVEFLENRGLIVAESPNAEFVIRAANSTTTWTNNGVIRAAGGTLAFEGAYATRDLGHVESTGGLVRLEGVIDNVNQTLIQNANTGGWIFEGNMTGGRIEVSDGVIPQLNGRLNNLTLAGNAQIGNGLSTIEGTFVERFTMEDAFLNLPSRSTLGVGNLLSIEGTGTIALNGASSQPARIQTYTGSVLTIGEGIQVVTGPQGGGEISRSSLPVINHGLISAQTQNQQIVIGGTLENTGTLQAASAGLLTINVASWTNQGTMRAITNGVIRVNSTSFENGINGVLEGNSTLAFVDPSVVNHGTISPVGTLVINSSLEMTDTARLAIELGPNGASDLLSLNGSLLLNGTLDVTLEPDFQTAIGDRYEILRTTLGEIEGQFANAPEFLRVGAVLFALDYQSRNVTLVTMSIPEPATWLAMLLISGLLGLWRYRTA